MLYERLKSEKDEVNNDNFNEDVNDVNNNINNNDNDDRIFIGATELNRKNKM